MIFLYVPKIALRIISTGMISTLAQITAVQPVIPKGVQLNMLAIAVPTPGMIPTTHRKTVARSIAPITLKKLELSLILLKISNPSLRTFKPFITDVKMNAAKNPVASCALFPLKILLMNGALNHIIDMISSQTPTKQNCPRLCHLSKTLDLPMPYFPIWVIGI